MKINNKRVKLQFAVLYLALLLLIIINILDELISGQLGNSISGKYLLMLLVLIFFLLYWRGFPHFYYDSEGEVLVIRASEPLLLSRMTENIFFAEFPKSKLTGFEIRRGFFGSKFLYLNIKGRTNIKTLRVAVSYLSKNEISLLNRSLGKILSKNIKKGNLQDERRSVRIRFA